MSARHPEEDALAALIALGKRPTPPHLAAAALPFVEQAKLRLKNFRVDLEAVQAAALAAGKDDRIAREDAVLMYHDVGEVVSRPLVVRYLEAGEAELVARWLMSRPGYHFTDWATERNLAALDGMIALGEQAMAVRLVRKHLEKVMATAKARWRVVGRKRPATMRPDLVQHYEAAMRQAIYELPGVLDAAALEIAELERYVREHGSGEDNKAIDAMQAELAKARERFTGG
jgi:hypothetical protein